MKALPRTPQDDRSTARSLTKRFSVAAATLSIAGLVLTACSSPGAQDEDVSAVGEKGAVGDVDLLSIVLVASDEGEPGRLLGSLENESDESVEVTLSDDDEDIVVVVPAGEVHSFQDNETIFDTVGDAPGAQTTITASTGTDSAELSVPVHDGTLERFRPYLPD